MLMCCWTRLQHQLSTGSGQRKQSESVSSQSGVLLFCTGKKHWTNRSCSLVDHRWRLPGEVSPWPLSPSAAACQLESQARKSITGSTRTVFLSRALSSFYSICTVYHCSQSFGLLVQQFSSSAKSSQFFVYWQCLLVLSGHCPPKCLVATECPAKGSSAMVQGRHLDCPFSCLPAAVLSTQSDTAWRAATQTSASSSNCWTLGFFDLGR